MHDLAIPCNYKIALLLKEKKKSFSYEVHKDNIVCLSPLLCVIYLSGWLGDQPPCGPHTEQFLPLAVHAGRQRGPPPRPRHPPHRTRHLLLEERALWYSRYNTRPDSLPLHSYKTPKSVIWGNVTDQDHEEQIRANTEPIFEIITRHWRMLTGFHMDAICPYAVFVSCSRQKYCRSRTMPVSSLTQCKPGKSDGVKMAALRFLQPLS